FYNITIPDYHLISANVRQEGDEYVVEFAADNLGEGQMPITIEAVAGKEDDESNFKTASTRVMIVQGKETKGVIRCSFKPEKVVLDRMYEVIDFDRGNNEIKF